MNTSGTQIEHKCWCKKQENFFKFQELLPKLLPFSKKNSKRNIFSAEKAGKYEGHFTCSIKRATFSVLDFYDFSWIFLDHKMSLPKMHTRLFWSEREGNECFTFLVFFCSKVEIPT